jgi:hypothetical protein
VGSGATNSDIKQHNSIMLGNVSSNGDCPSNPKTRLCFLPLVLHSWGNEIDSDTNCKFTMPVSLSFQILIEHDTYEMMPLDSLAGIQQIVQFFYCYKRCI